MAIFTHGATAASTCPASMTSPTVTVTAETIPGEEARRAVSIFIASTTATTSPSDTRVPVCSTASTVPGIFDVISPSLRSESFAV